MVESVPVQENGRIRVSTGEGFEQVPKKGRIRASTEKGSGRVLGNGRIGDRIRARCQRTTEPKGDGKAKTKALDA